MNLIRDSKHESTFEVMKLEREIEEAKGSLESQYKLIDAFIKEQEP